VVVPGHGKIPTDPEALIRSARDYITALRDSMQLAVRRGTSQQQTLAYLPPMDARRPVSLDSPLRRNGVRVYLEMEHAYMGIEDRD